MRFVLGAILFFGVTAGGGVLHGATVRMAVRVETREIRVQTQVVFTRPSGRVRIPLRARLLNLTSPGKASVSYFNDRNTIRIDRVLEDYQGRVSLYYSVPVAADEFVLEDWMAVPDEESETTVTVTGPAGQSGYFVPYRSREADGYRVSAAESPVLIWGTFRREESEFSGRSYDVTVKNRLDTSLSNVDALFRGYENWLFPLGRDRIHLLEIPALKNRRWIDESGIFLVLNGTRPEEIRRAVASLYFHGLMNWKPDADAFADLYRRALDDSGTLRSDLSYFSPVLPDSYYERSVAGGFERSSLLDCDMAGLLRNYPLLHLFAHTAGPENFLAAVRGHLATNRSRPEDLSVILTGQTKGDGFSDPLRLETVRFIEKFLLPVPRFDPDIMVRTVPSGAVLRNHDAIPDVALETDRQRRVVNWNGRRSVPLDAFDAKTVADPDRLIPQLNFENDRAFADARDAAEHNAVRRAAVAHRRFGSETVRAVIDLRRIPVPEKNYYAIPADTPVYAAVIRFTAPINGKLTEGVKDLILTVGTNGQASVIADRVRY